MIDLDQLKSINLSHLGEMVLEDEFKRYFLDEPGKEHYKLLAYIGTQYNKTSLLDIGTYKGCSALALSYNSNNTVTSFDIHHGLVALHEKPSNVEFVVDDILKDTYIDLILTSPFIMLDTAHDGPFEYTFYNHLVALNWKGSLLVDDIYLNSAMTEFWNSIDREKQDISNVGHHSGTGLVIFK